ncbi:MAG: serralysin, partial [Sulfurimonas sp.]|uniref:M12 family metallo-peptidase n=1 Tax=Sulfurimonas sp. TaxID=2022749 RepID=UPI0039E21C92
TLAVEHTDALSNVETLTLTTPTTTVANLNDTPIGVVSISGILTEDEILTASNTLADEDGLTTLHHQWQAGGVDIVGATNVNYTLTQAEVGSTITVAVSYTDSQGTLESVSSETSVAVGSAIFDTTAFSNINTGLGLLSNAATLGVSSLASDSYWDLVSDRIITYTFNTSIPSGYNSEAPLTAGWTQLSTLQKSAVNSIFNQLEDLLNITFTQVPDTSAQSDGDIQFNIVDMDSDTAGFAYYPGDFYNYEGDVFLSSDFNTDPSNFGLNSGEQGWATIVHELGHALGLEHSFDNDNTALLSSSLDDVNHTIMSYTNHNMLTDFTYSENGGGASISYLTSYLEPELYSLFDVATLQYVYGANTSSNSGNNIYTYSYTDYEMNTIWDAGGIDTINLTATSGASTIDLNAGSLNSADRYTVEEIIDLHQALVDVNGNNFDSFIESELNSLDASYGLYTGENNLAIATGSIIENVNSGSGSDTITDNEVDNIIQTFLGNDTIYIGNGGFDIVDGGGGIDTMYISLQQADVEISADLGNGSYNLVASDFAVNFTGIETIQFNDSVWTVA